MDKLKMLIIGGTGSLGKTLLKHFVDDYQVYVFSRDEAKHVFVKQLFPSVGSLIGDIRDRDAVFNAVIKTHPDIIINAAALKNVPEVEEVPMEGIKTSLVGTDNLVNAVKYYSLFNNKVIKVLTVSTDKACKPSNAYGMAKALQERVHIRANCPELICNAVRYGNVLESRGSLIPILHQRFSKDENVFVTHEGMTRFFLTLDESVALIKSALADGEGGKIFVPVIRSAKIVDVVNILRELYNRDVSKVSVSSIRPGEKLHEIMVSNEEAPRTKREGKIFVINDILSRAVFTDIEQEYSSGSPEVLMTKEELYSFLKESGSLHA